MGTEQKYNRSTMKVLMNAFLVVLAALLVVDTQAWSSFTGKSLSTSIPKSKSTISMEYIPSGMSKAQWEKIKAQEKNKSKGKDLGKTGITSFKSRSFMEWQKDGGKHLFPVDPNKVKSQKEIPYMQRQGGSADGEDLKKGGANKKKKGLFGW